MSQRKQCILERGEHNTISLFSGHSLSGHRYGMIFPPDASISDDYRVVLSAHDKVEGTGHYHFKKRRHAKKKLRTWGNHP